VQSVDWGRVTNAESTGGGGWLLNTARTFVFIKSPEFADQS
jgi:hypothetical protein